MQRPSITAFHRISLKCGQPDFFEELANTACDQLDLQLVEVSLSFALSPAEDTFNRRFVIWRAAAQQAGGLSADVPMAPGGAGTNYSGLMCHVLASGAATPDTIQTAATWIALHCRTVLSRIFAAHAHAHANAAGEIVHVIDRTGQIAWIDPGLPKPSWIQSGRAINCPDRTVQAALELAVALTNSGRSVPSMQHLTWLDEAGFQGPHRIDIRQGPALAAPHQPGGKLVALALRPLLTSRPLDKEVLTSTGLSPAQIALAAEIYAGGTLKDFAASRGVSHETARTQYKRLMAHLGVKKQSQLIQILTRLDQ